jgi:hypothetical protein
MVHLLMITHMERMKKEERREKGARNRLKMEDGSKREYGRPLAVADPIK